MTQAQTIPPAVRSAAETAVSGLLADRAFVAHVARQEVERLVASGTMVTAASLTLGQWQFTPAGRMAALEAAISGALDLLAADEPDLEEVRALLWSTIPEEDDPHVELDLDPQPEDEPETAVEPPPAKPKPVAKKATKKTSTAPAKAKRPAVKKSATGRPVEMPTEDEEFFCSECEVEVDFETAKMSWIRTRLIRCVEHFNVPSVERVAS